MRFHLNRKAIFYLVVGMLTSLLCLYFLWSYNTFDGAAFLYGCVLFPMAIFFLSRVPDDGIIGRWALPAYGLALNFLVWVVLNAAWKRLGQAAGEGLDAGILIIFCQFIGTVLSFSSKAQRIIRFRLGIGMAMFYPIAFLYLCIFVK